MERMTRKILAASFYKNGNKEGENAEGFCIRSHPLNDQCVLARYNRYEYASYA
jgi:hypothetical protein